MWKNNIPTSQEIDRLAKQWLHRTPPTGIRKEVLIPFEKRAAKKKQLTKADVIYYNVLLGVNQLRRFKKYQPVASILTAGLNTFNY
ncbi:MAG TPA: hypothetical protein PKN48_00845 [Bacteroidales bacterium]|nr:hypothetical protein [Bacteroidales bacterium]